MEAEQVARVVYELNRTLCELVKAPAPEPWKDIGPDQREGMIRAVRLVESGEIHNPRSAFRSWRRARREEGWKPGATKNEHTREHPDLEHVSFDHLPTLSQLKNHLFFQTVTHLLEHDSTNA